MAVGEDWLGWTIFVFSIVTVIMIVIKVFIEFPGLLEMKCVYKENNSSGVNNSELQIKHKERRVKNVRSQKISDQELLERTVNDEKCDYQTKNENISFINEVSYKPWTANKEEMEMDISQSKTENIPSIANPMITTKVENDVDEIAVVIERDPFQKKKKVIFNMTGETQADPLEENQTKTFSSFESSRTGPCVKFIPRRQAVLGMH